MTRKVLTWGEFIREFLKKNGPSYPHEVYRAYCEYLQSHGYNPPSYKTVLTYFYVLKKIGLIKEVKREKIRDTGYPWDIRVYYDLVEEKINSPDWHNPWKKYNPASALGSRYYRKKTKEIES